MSNSVSSTPLIPVPYFVIQENECVLDWIIKHFLLIFQSCYSTDTINSHLPSFSAINIQWLSASQIQGLRDETIRQLGIDQLNAFTPAQLGCLSASQQHMFEQLRRGPQLYLESQIPAETGFEANPAQETIAADNQDQLRGRISVFTYLTDTSAQASINPLLSAEERELLSDPRLAELLEDERHQRQFKYIFMDQLVYLSFFFKPQENLLNLTVEEAASLENTESAYLSAKLNGWIEMDEQTIDQESIRELTLLQFRSLSPEKINSLLRVLPPPLIALLSGYQLARLNTGLLNKEQVDALFDRHNSTGWAQIVRIFSPQQIKAMQNHLNGVTLQALPVEQTQALDTADLTQEQINHLFLTYHNFQPILAKFTPQQVRNMQDKLSGEILCALDEDQTHALDTAALTQQQVNEWHAHAIFPSPALAKFLPAQVLAMQKKLPGNLLFQLDDEILRSHINVYQLTEPQIRRLFSCGDHEYILSKFGSIPAGQLRRKIVEYGL